jgi:hypothetical protein
MVGAASTSPVEARKWRRVIPEERVDFFIWDNDDRMRANILAQNVHLIILA